MTGRSLRVDGSAVDIVAADYHRNGMGGEGFFVGLCLWDGRKMMLTYFPEHPDVAVAVIDVGMAANESHNIYMHRQSDGPEDLGTGGNAWRGDHWEHVAQEMVRIVEERWEAATTGA